ncbi:T9SS type B sorting domain-containing protein [Flavobacterium sp. CYK-4]|uniref:T9SS type B sorting domain-containing protein n=1 Tax=Flavobacterium lotistagni TaxID=2709660 RepID=UPI00140A5BA8|nr:T9SS type B sorting domain-containing protein [Flavobacterium lotistagni]NHM06359.1 T9SS type B sorting domain-containing protein [Flavobacterium lotistagni]
MKKLLLILATAMTVSCFSQAISVSTNTYTVPQLVNSVLINSPCVAATNITWRTGTNFNSSNGIGFFQNTNPRFPMQSGVMLSTGDVMHGAGPNSSDLNDGAANWPGDTDLEHTLSQSGIAMSSVNASVLEFDFTPISPTFNFEFLFASEEYGNFQCQFSDAFAFLLTNTATGVTTNLAVVPSTNIPISVVTIRDFLYNSSCPSANAQFFGSYNGGSAASSAAINFNGQTKLMNASAVLTPNTLYHIKLVIADRSDSGSDSAIFISSDTFNIGQDVLGLDITTAANTALCYGSSHTLNSNLNAANYTFSWTKDGSIVPGENGPSLTITEPGFYGITYQQTTSGCQPITDYITVQYLPEIITPDPINLYRCDTGAATYTYDLSLNTTVVKAGLNPLTQVSYYGSLANANAGISPLPNSYTAAPGTTIYVRIKSHNSACFIVKSFQLLTSAPPVANAAPNMTKCSGSSFNNAAFDLNQQNAVILGSQSASEYVVSYYTSQANANSGTNPIANNFTFATNNTTIYVRVQSAFDSTCFTTGTSFTLFVSPLPAVDTLQAVFVCENYPLPTLTNGNYFTGPNGTGTALFAGDLVDTTSTIYIFNQPNGPGTCSNSSTFQVTILDPETIVPEDQSVCGSYTLTAPAVGGYFTGPSGTGTELLPGTVISSTQTINFYYAATEPPFCVIDDNFTVTILSTVTLGTFENAFDCTSYTLPALSEGNYYTQPNGGGTQIAAGTILTSSQTVYVHAETPDHCTADASFEVIIGLTIPADVAQCNPYTLPVLPVGKYYTAPQGGGTEIQPGTVINLSQTVYVYVANAGGNNCTDNAHFNIAIAQPIIDTLADVTVCESYTLPVLSSGEYYTGSNATGTHLFAGDLIVSTQTVYIFKQSVSSATCNNESSFVVTISAKPVIDSRSDIDICNSYTLTNLSVGNYYTGPNGTGTMLPGGTVITTSQRIYIYAVATTAPFCTNENSFYISVFSIEADAPSNVTACDRYVLPALTVGNYYKLPGGPHSGEGNLMLAGDVITTSQTIYVYTESGERINCIDENTFTVTINVSPVIAPIADVFAANAYVLPALPVGNYFTGTNGTGTPLNAGDSITSNQTIYVYAETGTTPNCTDEKSFYATIYNVDEVADVTTCESYILPTLTIGGYYTGPLGTGTHLLAGQRVNTSQTIYIYGTAPFDATQYDESSFDVTIIDTPVVYPVPANLLRTCDTDGTNDGLFNFDLTTLDSSALGNQTGSEFTVTYYTSFNDAVTGTNAVTVTDAKTIYVKVTNNLTATCFDVKSLQIKVNKLPEPTPQGGIMCYDSVNNVVLNPYTISSGLSASAYMFKWYNEDGALVGSGSTYQAMLPGVYSVVATDILTGCDSEPMPATVGSSEPAVVSYAVTEAFDDNQVITIQTIGAGDYEYQLDHGLFQDSPIFENVSSGIHTVTVRDKNGCGMTSTQALIVNYPKFFTPNGDGFNDTWNIKALENQAKSVIYIFDRYGKIMTQIKPDGNGWDGTFSGQMMPSDDYWFTITYQEDNVEKEFKSHFSMKR